MALNAKDQQITLKDTDHRMPKNLCEIAEHIARGTHVTVDHRVMLCGRSALRVEELFLRWRRDNGDSSWLVDAHDVVILSICFNNSSQYLKQKNILSSSAIFSF
jgi:hypothetical protein